LGEYLTCRWLPGQVSQLSPSTYDSYRRNIDLHVIPRIGGVPLQKLAAEDLDGLYAALSSPGGRRDGTPGGLSPKSVRIVHSILHKALSDARRKGTLTRNVAEVADAPKARSAAKRPEIKVWTPEELHAFLDLVADNRHHAAWFVSSHTGMRRGEILGLRWSDLDLDGRKLSVCQAVILVAYKLTISDVKTDTGRRSIDLDDRTIAVLRSWRKRQLEERMLVGPDAYKDHDLVFARPDGTPVNPDAFSQSFDRIIARSTLPRIRLHDLRHTHASILLRAGVNVKVVSERLGHANPAFTITVYQHIIPGMQAGAATVFSDLVAGVLPPAVEISDVADDE
ncbi:MAG: tyrosine-type recombinase/integrase, partial [Thermoleophilaceae bacterium]